MPLTLLCAAALCLAAQAPFFRGMLKKDGLAGTEAAFTSCTGLPLLGAMLILRISPALGGTLAGSLTICVGVITMLCAGICGLCAKRLEAGPLFGALLGAVAVLGGLSLAQSLWAGSMLLVFLSVAGGLVISREGTGASLGRLSGGMPVLFLAAVVGAKKSTLSVLMTSGNLLPLLAILVVCALLLWAGAGTDERREEEGNGRNDGLRIIPTILAGMEVLLCAAFPLLSRLMAGFVSASFSNVPEDFSSLTQGDFLPAVVLTAAALILLRSGKESAGSAVLPKANGWLCGDSPAAELRREEASLWIGRIGTFLSAFLWCAVLAVLWGGVL